jgi:hypothetical protein
MRTAIQRVYLAGEQEEEPCSLSSFSYYTGKSVKVDGYSKLVSFELDRCRCGQSIRSWKFPSGKIFVINPLCKGCDRCWKEYLDFYEIHEETDGERMFGGEDGY